MPFLPAYNRSENIPDDNVAFDETGRLEALHACGILDTPEDEGFNRLTRLACILTGMPIATISLIDENRQWLKSQTGIGTGHGQQVARSISFCTHALGSDDIMVVPDSHLDPRFASNPLVLGAPHIRFCVGAPLISTDGHRIGTFCIMDRKPHTRLNEQQRRVVTEFSFLTMELIESRWAERRRMEAEEDLKQKILLVQQQTQLFQNTLDTIDQGLSVLDPDFRLIMANRAFQTLYNLPDSLCEKGTGFENHIRYYLTKRNYSGDIESEIVRLRTMIYDPAGSVLYVKTSIGRIIEIRTHALPQGGYVTTHTDITQIRTTEKELRRQEQLKDEFISSISHELRTPLTSLNGALGVLSSGDLPAKARRLIEIAETNSTRLIRLVNDLLDFERMIQGKYTLNLAFADLKAVIANAIATLEPYGEGLGVRFDASGVEMTGTIECDEERIAQVLLNLLSNAAKFSPSGSIVHVKARLLPAAVRVEVVDHGCGIPEAFTDRIFEKFAQANRSDSRKQGSGLGLSIAKMTVEAHHGTIGFESHEGQGSLFWFELPSKQQSP